MEGDGGNDIRRMCSGGRGRGWRIGESKMMKDDGRNVVEESQSSMFQEVARVELKEDEREGDDDEGA